MLPQISQSSYTQQVKKVDVDIQEGLPQVLWGRVSHDRMRWARAEWSSPNSRLCDTVHRRCREARVDSSSSASGSTLSRNLMRPRKVLRPNSCWHWRTPWNWWQTQISRGTKRMWSAAENSKSRYSMNLTLNSDVPKSHFGYCSQWPMELYSPKPNLD